MAEKQRHPLHAVVVPFPAQGHVNPLMHFANLMAARGHFITFVTTGSFAEQNFCPSNGYVEASSVMQHPHESGLSGFRFLCIGNGLPSGHVSPTHEVATALGVPRVVFWTYCATAAIATTNFRLLLAKGYIPVKAAKRPENLITCLPGNIPPLWPTDLLSVFRVQDTTDAFFQIALFEADMPTKADYVLVNSFEEIEGPDTVSGLSQGYPSLAIGPVFLAESLTGNAGAVVPIGSSAWEEDSECLKWLDTQTPGSVLYVSFGSIVVMSNLQLQELSFGLKVSRQPFLWALRPDAAQGKSAVLPEGFVEGTNGRGLIVEWTPHRKVLSHPCVGGFMTHCGWNSTLETISFGVPLIGWPLRAGQVLNCRFAKEIWKIGMDFDSRSEDENVLVTRDEVEKVVRALMQGQEGKNLRLKEAAVKAVMLGGSCFINLDKFAEDMTRRANSV
eukprot:Gb_30223 [translate_table: standard]